VVFRLMCQKNGGMRNSDNSDRWSNETGRYQVAVCHHIVSLSVHIRALI
jgi:hypothetical protein